MSLSLYRYHSLIAVYNYYTLSLSLSLSLSLPVILYSCALLGTNCGQCLAQEQRYECSYCYNPATSNGNCQLTVTCPTNEGLLSLMDPANVSFCPRPQILNVRKIFIEAGTGNMTNCTIIGKGNPLIKCSILYLNQ